MYVKNDLEITVLKSNVFFTEFNLIFKGKCISKAFQINSSIENQLVRIFDVASHYRKIECELLEFIQV